jgi:hypothetical protein
MHAISNPQEWALSADGTLAVYLDMTCGCLLLVVVVLCRKNITSADCVTYMNNATQAAIYPMVVQTVHRLQAGTYGNRSMLLGMQHLTCSHQLLNG